MYNFWNKWLRANSIERVDMLKQTLLKDLNMKLKTKGAEKFLVLQTINSYFEDLEEVIHNNCYKEQSKIIKRIKDNLPTGSREDAGADFNLKQCHLMLQGELMKLGGEHIEN